MTEREGREREGDLFNCLHCAVLCCLLQRCRLSARSLAAKKASVELMPWTPSSREGPLRRTPGIYCSSPIWTRRLVFCLLSEINFVGGCKREEGTVGNFCSCYQDFGGGSVDVM